jgi:arylsulfatase A-like enzyme
MKMLGATLAIAGAISLPALGQEAVRRPNIVLILADDLGWGDLGCYGQKRIKTPNLDALAAGGIRFTQCYAGSTVCAPSRCCLMTGYHTGRARVRGNGPPKVTSLQAGDITVAKVMQKAGYRTAVIGKWGLGQPDSGGEAGVPSRQGFDESYGFLNHSHAHNYYPSYLYRNEVKESLKNSVPDERPTGAGVSSNKAQYAHDLITDEALAFVRRNKQRPFFLFWAPTIPHANNEAKNLGMEVPDLGEYAKLDLNPAAKAHAAMISRLDRDVGRLVKLLSDTDVAHNTIVIFTSDNGPHKEGGYHFDMNDSNGPLHGGKRDLYEGGIRVPMIVTGAGMRKGVTDSTPWAFWDVLPTLADLAGGERPQGLDGISMANVLRGESDLPKREYFYWEFHEGSTQQAVRIGDWKAIRKSPSAPVELYDLSKDPSETTNVAGENETIARKAADIIRMARSSHPDWPLRENPKGKKKD